MHTQVKESYLWLCAYRSKIHTYSHTARGRKVMVAAIYIGQIQKSKVIVTVMCTDQIGTEIKELDL